MHSIRLVVSAMLVVSMGLSACGGGSSSGSSGGLIDVTDDNAVSDALVVKFGSALGEKLAGDLPATTNTGSEPIINSASDSLAAVNGEKLSLGLQIDSASALTSLLVKVVGSDSLLAIDLSSASRRKVTTSGSLEIDIPSNISDGTFCIEIIATDDAERVSERARVCIDVESTADGDSTPQGFSAFNLEGETYFNTYADDEQNDFWVVESIRFDQSGNGVELDGDAGTYEIIDDVLVLTFPNDGSEYIGLLEEVEDGHWTTCWGDSVQTAFDCTGLGIEHLFTTQAAAQTYADQRNAQQG
ncbi:hypothetical protein [Algiphilus sp.]|uniref:hypothetical protein n=1 Tax=Algiphilus sp. TaxID=1872431 RepID=UPI003C42D050